MNRLAAFIVTVLLCTLGLPTTAAAQEPGTDHPVQEPELEPDLGGAIIPM